METYGEQHFTATANHPDAATLYLDRCSVRCADLTLERVVQHLERKDLMARCLSMHLCNEQTDGGIWQGYSVSVISY